MDERLKFDVSISQLEADATQSIFSVIKIPALLMIFTKTDILLTHDVIPGEIKGQKYVLICHFNFVQRGAVYICVE